MTTHNVKEKSDLYRLYEEAGEAATALLVMALGLAMMAIAS